MPTFCGTGLVYSYSSITAHCERYIWYFVRTAERSQEPQAQVQRERAYGVYMGWRSMVIELADPLTFAVDDKRLEAALSGVALAPPGRATLREDPLRREIEVEWRAPTKVQ